MSNCSVNVTHTNKLRLRKVIHGAVISYINDHGYALADNVAVSSLEKRVLGAVWNAVKTGQLDIGVNSEH